MLASVLVGVLMALMPNLNNLKDISKGLFVGILPLVPIALSSAAYRLTWKKAVAAVIYWSIVVAWEFYWLCEAMAYNCEGLTGQVAIGLFFVSALPAVSAYVVMQIGFRKPIPPAA